MRPRTELALAAMLVVASAGYFAVRAIGAGEGVELQRTSYRSSRAGARAWTDGLERMGVEVRRLRRPLYVRDTLKLSDDRLLAVLDPTAPLDLSDATTLGRRIAKGGAVLLAGRGARLGMLCAGWDFTAKSVIPSRMTGTVDGQEIAIDAVQGTLVPLDTAARGRQQRIGGGCATFDVERVDTLLRNADGLPGAVRLTSVGGGEAILVADGRLFSAEKMRTTPAGEFTLSLAVPRFTAVDVDEFHHGYGATGSLSAELRRWSFGSPWGWAIWHGMILGVLLLLAALPRATPLVAAPRKSRRSPLEHVRALAHALAATRGHDTAIRLLVGGLRRRLSADGRPTRDDPRPWLDLFVSRMRTEKGRAAARALQGLTGPGQDAQGVLQAANAVETVWEETRP